MKSDGTGKIVITGGSGLIGRMLISRLVAKGYRVTLLSRHRKNDLQVPVCHWNPGRKTIDPDALQDAEAIIHLAGTGIGDQRWTRKRKREIISSRVDTALFLLEEVQKAALPLKTFISSSATGYYGAITTPRIYKEEDFPAGDFLGQTCSLWEEVADRFAETGARVVKIRTGIVLSGEGGALPRMTAPVRLAISPVFGKGKQWIPWIHISDLCDLYIKALEDPSMEGAYNGVSPQAVTGRDFMREAANAMGKPFIPLCVPPFSMKWILGEMSAILLEGSRVSCGKALQAGFDFRYPDLNTAMGDIFNPLRSSAG
jgi:uncharacterized protein